jgi:uncharacterized protein
MPALATRPARRSLGAVATAALVALAAGPVSAQQPVATGDSAGAYRAPAPVGFVNDFAGVVPAACAAPMRRMIEEVRAKSKGEIAVVTLPTLGGRRLEDVSLAIARQWGVGYAGAPDDPRTNTGVLVLLAPGERRSRVELASGARRFLSDSASGAIQDSAMVPAFRRKAYGVGLVRGVEAIAQRFAARFGFTLASAATDCDVAANGS